MPDFTGSLYQGDKLVRDHIEGYFEILEERSGLKSWSGCLAMEKPVEYTIHFEDGSQGDILIDRLTVSSHQEPSISFLGSGPLRNAQGVGMM